MARGDHVFVWRRFGMVPFQHHAIDLGDGRLVHFSDGDDGIARPGLNPERFVVSCVDSSCLIRRRTSRLHVVRYRRDASSADEIVDRAQSQLGRRGYHLLYDNCEHFASWCVTGRPASVQIDTAFSRAGSVAVKSTVLLAARIALKSSSALRPWTLAADAVQFGTEAVGHHVGLDDPKLRKNAGRALGGLTALGIGAVGGPVGMAIAGGTWVLGELGSEIAYRAIEHDRKHRTHDVSQKSWSTAGPAAD